MTRTWRAIVTAAFVIAVAACGADDQSSTTADPEAGGGSTTACDVLTQEEATALIGEPVEKADLPEDADQADDAALGEDMCIYIPAGTSILDEGRPYLGVRLERDAYEAPADIRNGMPVSESPGSGEFAVSEVSGLGEYAVYFPSEDEPSVTVYVNPELTFRIWGSGGEVTEQRLVEGARQVEDKL